MSKSYALRDRWIYVLFSKNIFPTKYNLFFVSWHRLCFCFLILRFHSLSRSPATPTSGWSVVWIFKKNVGRCIPQAKRSEYSKRNIQRVMWWGLCRHINKETTETDIERTIENWFILNKVLCHMSFKLTLYFTKWFHTDKFVY